MLVDKRGALFRWGVGVSGALLVDNCLSSVIYFGHEGSAAKGSRNFFISNENQLQGIHS